jgi:beta-glucosidase-like glycosyl hydrolase
MTDKTKKGGWLQTLATSVAILVGVGNLGFVMTNWGAMAEKVRQHDVRLANVEASGSAVAQQHIKQDDERVSDIKRRLEKVEDALGAISDIRSDIAAMKVILAALSKKP